MKRNKYITFVAIGFELIALILIGIYGGEYLVNKLGAPEWSKAATIVIGFIVWFVSLIVKLKNAERND
jgi:nitrate reductase NapE component